MLYFLYPQLRKLSGAERLILRLAAHAAELGAPLTLITQYLDATCRPALDPRVRVIETGQRANLFHNHYLDAAVEYVYSLRLLKHVGSDAAALTFFGPPSLPALFWSKWVQRRPAPHLYFCYEPPRFIYDDTPEITARLGALGLLARPLFALYKTLDRTMAQCADALLANSAFGAQRLHTAYGRAATVITHGADFEPPVPAQVEALCARHRLAGKCVLLTVNFLHPRKRIDLFLRAFRLIHARRPNAVALVVGAGPERARLQGLTRELQLDPAVIFTGFVPDAELPAYYALADLYIHTCKLESFGLSVLEASAAGVPVVAVNEGGPREIVVDGETGALVAASPEAIANAAVGLLDDPARRTALGAAAQRRVRENYSWTRGAEIFLDTVRLARAAHSSSFAERL
jgi:glycosyltransferase involved in cell wall biosynthesis